MQEKNIIDEVMKEIEEKHIFDGLEEYLEEANIIKQVIYSQKMPDSLPENVFRDIRINSEDKDVDVEQYAKMVKKLELMYGALCETLYNIFCFYTDYDSLPDEIKNKVNVVEKMKELMPSKDYCKGADRIQEIFGTDSYVEEIRR